MAINCTTMLTVIVMIKSNNNVVCWNNMHGLSLFNTVMLWLSTVNVF